MIPSEICSSIFRERSSRISSWYSDIHDIHYTFETHRNSLEQLCKLKECHGEIDLTRQNQTAPVETDLHLPTLETETRRKICGMKVCQVVSLSQYLCEFPSGRNPRYETQPATITVR